MNRVRVANELGTGYGKGAKFATKVAVMTSVAGLLATNIIALHLTVLVFCIYL
jgi:hypothetical protein